MKKFEYSFTDDDVISIRTIDPSEWDDLNNAMEQVQKEAKRMGKQSWLSCLKVWVG